MDTSGDMIRNNETDLEKIKKEFEKECKERFGKEKVKNVKVVELEDGSILRVASL